MSSIQQRAKIELDRINFGEEDTAAMLEILARFFKQWDSGGAVSVAAPVLCRLLDGKPLAPLTGADNEWHDPMGDGVMLQNVRMGTVFKSPDGRCYDIEDPERQTITFPYSGYIPVRGPIMPELTPEQQKAFEEEWSKPHSGYITWNNDLSKPCPVSVDPGPAIGEPLSAGELFDLGVREHLTDIDADELPEDILASVTTLRS